LKNGNQLGQNRIIMQLLKKVLIANRGEIAVRIIKTLKKLGIDSVAIYSLQDSNSLHVKLADEAYDLGGSVLEDTYLNIPKIIEIALKSGVDGIHPGYGFLSENPDFSKAAADSGINFIGPDAEIIGLMGDKIQSRKVMLKAGIPMIEGLTGSPEELISRERELHYPLLVKASAGGGGKAMRIVQDQKSLVESIQITAREAQNYFGNNQLFIERYLPVARHIEVQIMVDHYGNSIILGNRECSIQRRYQKVIEEAPAVSVSQRTRDEIYQTVKKIIEIISYQNAGTLEFLVDSEGNHFFLEMNTRIQVEHAVTEMVTGVDVVELQILIAAGNVLPMKQENIVFSGHAIEARIYAEDTENGFLPSPGEITLYSEPEAIGLRIDSGFDGPGILFPEYDPLIAKVVFHAENRTSAIAGLELALKKFVIHGPKNNREFLVEILQNSAFLQNEISTNFLEKHCKDICQANSIKKSAFNRNLIFSAWLVWKFRETHQPAGLSVWEKIGEWRALQRKSVYFHGKQVDFLITGIKDKKIVFELENNSFEVKIILQNDEKISFEFEGETYFSSLSVKPSGENLISIAGMQFSIFPLDFLPKEPYFLDAQSTIIGGKKTIKSPLHGKISSINAGRGQDIKKGDFLFSLDTMKIENKVTSLYDGQLIEILVNAGDQVHFNQDIMIIE